MIQIDNLSLSYTQTASGDPLKVIDSISFEVATGGYCSIIGPSGCGKSSLLLCVAGLIPINHGNIFLNGVSPTGVRECHKIGLVFQKPVFFEWQSILENVALPATLSGRNDAITQALRYLGEFHLDGTSGSFPHELSGGMLARAALARALVTEPDYLLLDEAFNYLDEALRDKINLDIQEYWINHRPTVLAVTHSIAEAVLMSDYIVVLSQKPAYIIQTFEVPFERPRKVSMLSETRILRLIESVRGALELSYSELSDAKRQ